MASAHLLQDSGHARCQVQASCSPQNTMRGNRAGAFPPATAFPTSIPSGSGDTAPLCAAAGSTYWLSTSACALLAIVVGAWPSAAKTTPELETGRRHRWQIAPPGQIASARGCPKARARRGLRASVSAACSSLYMHVLARWRNFSSRYPAP